MSILKPHVPLDRGGERLLVYVADPLRRSPALSWTPDIEQLGLILTAAEKHGVLPAAIRGLNELIQNARESGRADATTVDQATEALEAARLKLAYQTGFRMMMSHHARQIMAAFASAGIAGAVVKGAAFAQRLYHEPSLRTFTDVDILISEQHRYKTGEVMRALGFELFEFEDRKGKDYHEQKWLLPPQNDIMIEVHSNLVHSPKLRGAMSVGYEDVLAAGDGDCSDATALLFVAAAHGSVGHQLDRLQHLVDVMQAARGAAGPIDAARLARVSQRCGLTFAIFGALELAGKTFGELGCFALAKHLKPSIIARLPGQLLSPALVVRGQSEARNRGSWRRNLFRQALRVV